MSSHRTLILIAAVVVGLIAAYALWAYIGGIEDEANNNAERVEIFKIVQDIPKGTFGDEAFTQGWIEKDVIAKEYRPATAITDPSQIEGLVAISDLAANQVVVSNQFVTQQVYCQPSQTANHSTSVCSAPSAVRCSSRRCESWVIANA